MPDKVFTIVSLIQRFACGCKSHASYIIIIFETPKTLEGNVSEFSYLSILPRVWHVWVKEKCQIM